ncbi:hypothetical protein [Sandaracinus amylolyticus]|uniref:hypothetical protein n=1 Tax=Sandaracinus amylolyticus TaxID=927083 RepID=UPI001F3DE119|nr:hypothetical protein [Sandaracinus amylolyticus]UJR79057.1 Hypothetical protein I5071_10900 [Sandaracinus amylolyticus]
MRRWLTRWFPVRSLDHVGAGAYGLIGATVISADSIASTIAPTHAAAIRWTLLYEHSQVGSSRGGGGRDSTLHPFASGWRGESIVLRAACGRTIGVALGDARLRAPIDPADGTPLGTSPASSATYGALVSRAPAGSGTVFVREHGIQAGQTVRLHAWLEPVGSTGGYRDAASPTTVQFRATDVTLEDDLRD